MREPAEPVLSEMIAQALRQKIIAGELLPGARLSERELTSQLDISRNTLREVFVCLPGRAVALPAKPGRVCGGTHRCRYHRYLPHPAVD